jgi:hypothetical protein
MIVLSKKARRFIELGAHRLPDRDLKAAWWEWSAQHPLPQGSYLTQEKESLPDTVLDAAIAALDMQIQDLQDLRSKAGEDEVYEFDNDISYILAIESSLKASRRNAPH